MLLVSDEKKSNQKLAVAHFCSSKTPRDATPNQAQALGTTRRTKSRHQNNHLMSLLTTLIQHIILKPPAGGLVTGNHGEEPRTAGCVTSVLIAPKKHWRRRRNSAASRGRAARRWRTIVKAELTCDLSSSQPSLEGDNGPEVVSGWGFNGGNNLSINIEEGDAVSVN